MREIYLVLYILWS